jgi:hypothetical protein
MRLPAVLAMMILAGWPLLTSAEHANIDLRVVRLQVEQGAAKDQDKATAVADEEPPIGGVNPRPLLKVKAKEPLVLQFILTNTYPHGNLKDVTVRYYVVREDKPRQKIAPDPKKGAVTQGQFKMNFKPKCRVGARLAFSINEPGVYLVRVETVNTHSDHEHFSAIDLQVE